MDRESERGGGVGCKSVFAKMCLCVGDWEYVFVYIFDREERERFGFVAQWMSLGMLLLDWDSGHSGPRIRSVYLVGPTYLQVSREVIEAVTVVRK